MPQDRTPAAEPESETSDATPSDDSVPPEAADSRARDVIARALAQKKQGGPAHGGAPGRSTAAQGPRRSGFTPAPIRPGGRGRRG
jgi:hypothetical protein